MSGFSSSNKKHTELENLRVEADWRRQVVKNISVRSCGRILKRELATGPESRFEQYDLAEIIIDKLLSLTAQLS